MMKHNDKISTPWYKMIWKTLLIATVFFTFSLTTANAQDEEGSTCDAPIEISNLPFEDSGNTADYGNNYTGEDIPEEAPDAVTDGSGSIYYLDGYEVVYAYTPSSDEVITISADLDIEAWHSIYVFTGCPFSATVGYHTNTVGTSRIIENLPVTADETYYILVSDWDIEDVEYTIEITALEDCTDADAGEAMDDFMACPGVTFTLENDNVSEGDSGLSYQWEESEDGNSWTDIEEATNITYTTFRWN